MSINKNLRILLYGSSLWCLGEGMLGPLFAVFTERIGGNILDISGAWAVYLVIAGCLHIVFGKLVDGKYSREKIMIFGYALNALFTFGYLLVRSPWHLFFIQAGLGVASALVLPTWDALFAKYEYADGKHDAFEWGIAEGSDRIITGIAIIIGGMIVNYFSFTTLFFMMGTVQVVALIYQARILKR